jgi:hypothetical protein
VDESLSFDESEFAYGLIEGIFRHAVHNGSTIIDDRPSETIVLEFLYYLRSTIDSFKEPGASAKYGFVTNFLEDILSRAMTDAESGNDELAVSSYATWLEHFFNWALTGALRRKGYSAEYITPLIRELRLRTKAFSLWKIADLPPIDQPDLNLIDSIVSHRNSFLHYKWIERDPDDDAELDKQLHLIVSKASPLIERLLALESSAVWFGRENELIHALRMFKSEAKLTKKEPHQFD